MKNNENLYRIVGQKHPNTFTFNCTHMDHPNAIMVKKSIFSFLLTQQHGQ